MMFKRLSQLAESANNTETPKDVLAATCSVMAQFGGKFVKSQEARPPEKSTADNVRCALWPGLYGTGDNRVVQAAAQMSNPYFHQQAQEMLDWFDTMPPAEKLGNDYLAKVNQIIKSGAVSPKDVATLCSLWSVYNRSVGFGQQKMIVNWPTQWGDVKMIYRQPAEIKACRQTPTGSGYVVNAALGSGHVTRWFSSHPYDVGAKVTMTGYLEPDTYGRNKDNPKIQFVPEHRWKKNEGITYNKRVNAQYNPQDDESDDSKD